MKVAVLPGDGIGPEVMESALQVLTKVEEKFGFKLELTEGLIGGIAYDETGSPLPDETKKICEESDAVLLGSIGGPKWDGLPPEKTPELGGLLALRKMLKLYANLRPAVIYEELKAMSPPLREGPFRKGRPADRSRTGPRHLLRRAQRTYR